MVLTVFATKKGMSQAWTKAGKRLPVTVCRVDNNVVLGQDQSPSDFNVIKIGYGTKPLKNVKKPLREQIKKSGFSLGVGGMAGVRVSKDSAELSPTIRVEEVLSVGDVVKVQGTTKGRGFAGGIKRHGFSGGPKTHGQSDRERAVGSIGSGTTPGKVWKGKKMPGRYGTDTKTVAGLVVVHLDPATQEVWLSGPVPGHFNSIVRIEKQDQKRVIDLEPTASGIKVEVEEVKADQEPEAQVETDSADDLATTKPAQEENTEESKEESK